MLSIACLVACLGVLGHFWCYGEFIINLHIHCNYVFIITSIIIDSNRGTCQQKRTETNRLPRRMSQLGKILIEFIQRTGDAYGLRSKLENFREYYNYNKLEVQFWTFHSVLDLETLLFLWWLMAYLWKCSLSFIFYCSCKLSLSSIVVVEPFHLKTFFSCVLSPIQIKLIRYFLVLFSLWGVVLYCLVVSLLDC